MSEHYIAKRPKRAPTHPGQLLSEVVLPSLDISITDAADKLGISRQQLHNLLSEKAGVSSEMALRLGKFCGNGPDLWLSMQQAYDLWQARKEVGREIDRIETMPAKIAVV